MEHGVVLVFCFDDRGAVGVGDETAAYAQA